MVRRAELGSSFLGRRGERLGLAVEEGERLGLWLAVYLQLHSSEQRSSELDMQGPTPLHCL
jgi:hypothetical protein